jgi:hypothetical protein
MKVLAILTFMLGILFVAPAYAQQKGTLTFNGNVFDAPSAQGAGFAQGPGYAQPPAAKAKTYRHAKRHIPPKHSAS